jgi:hypothetical protein
MGLFRTPTTHGDMVSCISKLYNALVNLDEVWDKQSHPEDYERFLAGGGWSDPQDLHAVSLCIHNALMKLHTRGVQGPMLRLPGNFRQPAANDVDFTFGQRLYWTSFLLRRYKAHDNRFMCQNAVEAHVARIWSVLMLEPSFQKWWARLNAGQIINYLCKQPYFGVTSGNTHFYHPTAEEVQNCRNAGSTQVDATGIQQVQTQGPARSGSVSEKARSKRPGNEELGMEAGPPGKHLRAVPSVTIDRRNDSVHIGHEHLPSAPPPVSNYEAVGTEAGTGEEDPSLPQYLAGYVEDYSLLQDLAGDEEVDEAWWDIFLAEGADSGE